MGSCELTQWNLTLKLVLQQQIHLYTMGKNCTDGVAVTLIQTALGSASYHIIILNS